MGEDLLVGGGGDAGSVLVRHLFQEPTLDNPADLIVHHRFAEFVFAVGEIGDGLEQGDVIQ